MIAICKEDLEQLCRKALESAGVPSRDAELAAQSLVAADLLGIGTHGVRRLPPYLERIHRGVLTPRPRVQVSIQSPSLAIVDGDNGLGPVVASRGLEQALELTEEVGLAFVVCRNSNHFGAIAPYLLSACSREKIAIIGTNAFPSMAPAGGREIRIGNNPLGIGAPRREGAPFLLDIAMSMVARSKIRSAQQRGQTIPENWALDSQGRPTRDPIEALKGFVLPIGAHKGSGLALAIDLLAGVLSGGAFATGVKSMFQQFDEPQHVAHFFILLDPSKLMSLQNYYERIEAFCSCIKQTDPMDPAHEVLLPGEIEFRTYEERMASGIPLEEDFYEVLEHLSEGKREGRIPKY